MQKHRHFQLEQEFDRNYIFVRKDEQVDKSLLRSYTTIPHQPEIPSMSPNTSENQQWQLMCSPVNIVNRNRKEKKNPLQSFTDTNSIFPTLSFPPFLARRLEVHFLLKVSLNPLHSRGITLFNSSLRFNSPFLLALAPPEEFPNSPSGSRTESRRPANKNCNFSLAVRTSTSTCAYLFSPFGIAFQLKREMSKLLLLRQPLPEPLP
jgi:hypothetical protein